jgi:hypothetical protein
MSFNWSLRVPFRYGDSYITLRQLEQHLLVHYHPEYVRRLLAWLNFKGGKVGVGGDWRAGGAQPDRLGFAPEGKSFHQDQAYNDGFVGACAVDTVFEDGPDPGDDHDGIAWREVPQQGSAEAARWGVHANVGVPGNGESWHIQPVEIDGWQTWWNTGRVAPRPGYPIPAAHDPYPTAPPDVIDPEDDMRTLPARRVTDTRGQPGTPGRDTYKAAAGSTSTITIAEAKGFDLAQVTVTVAEPEGPGHLTTWPEGAKPNTSFSNYVAGQTIPQTLLVELDANGSFRLFTLARTHLIVDFTGAVATA